MTAPSPAASAPPLTGHIGFVASVAFSPDGHTLATGSDDRSVILWDLAPLENLRRAPVQEACTRAGTSLDTSTWSLYVPGLSYQDTCAKPLIR